MERKGAVSVAVVAALINLAVIAAVGNQWYLDHILDKSSSNGANEILKRVPHAFSWELSHWSGDHGLRLGHLIGCATVVVLVFFLTLIVVRAQRRPRGFFGSLFAIWGVVLFSAVLAAMVTAFASYNGVYGDQPNPLGTTRFWWSVTEGPASTVVLWGLAVGLLTALFCAFMTALQGLDEDDYADGAPRPEDAFFPPRTPQLGAPASPATAVAASGAGNPELAAYGWSPQEHPADEPTAQQPTAQHAADDQHTEQLPAQPQPEPQPEPAPRAESEPEPEPDRSPDPEPDPAPETEQRHRLYSAPPEQPAEDGSDEPAGSGRVDPTQEIPVREPDEKAADQKTDQSTVQPTDRPG